MKKRKRRLCPKCKGTGKIEARQRDGSHSAVKITGIGVEKSPAEVAAGKILDDLKVVLGDFDDFDDFYIREMWKSSVVDYINEAYAEERAEAVSLRNAVDRITGFMLYETTIETKPGQDFADALIEHVKSLCAERTQTLERHDRMAGFIDDTDFEDGELELYGLDSRQIAAAAKRHEEREK